MKRFSAEEILAMVNRDYGDIDERDLYSIYEWIVEAIAKIGTEDSLIRKECLLDVKDYRAKLPDDLVRLLYVKHSGRYVPYTERHFVHFYKSLDDSKASHLAEPYTVSPYNYQTSHYEAYSDVVYYVSNNYIHITLREGKIGIAYLALPLDERGLPTVYHLHADAVVAYIVYKLIARKFFKGDIPNVVYREAEHRWHWLCGQVRGQTALRSADELTTIAKRVWNNLKPLGGLNLT